MRMKLEEWVSKLRGKDWDPILNKLHIATVRTLMSITAVFGVYAVYGIYQLKREADLREEVNNFRRDEEIRRGNIHEGTREDMIDMAQEQKDSAKRYKF